MYKILENHERLTVDEIEQKYKGNWVYIVDLHGPPLGMFETGIVAVVADTHLEGLETGIYDELDERHDRVMGWAIPPLKTPRIFGFSEVAVNET